MKTRREFVAAVGMGLAAIPVATVAATTVQARKTLPTVVSTERTPELIGKVTITVDGHDVTNDCFWANSEVFTHTWSDGTRSVDGRAKVYRRNADGHYYVWGTSADPDPATRRLEKSKAFKRVGGKDEWEKPYPGYGDIAYHDFSGEVKIEWKR